MPGRFFLDSNIILYNFDTDALQKQSIARALVKRAGIEKEGCISMQVVQECLNVLTSKRKHLQPSGDIRHYLDTVLEPLMEPLLIIPLYRSALSLQERWQFGFYDALIVAAALALDCDRLYTEDLQHGQRVEGLVIVNPFLEARLS